MDKGSKKETRDSLSGLEEKYRTLLSDDYRSLAFVFLAQILYRKNELNKAMDVLIKGLRYHKQSVTGRFLLGKIYYDFWMIRQAKEELQAVIKLSPDNLAAGAMLVQMYRSEGDLDKSLDILKLLKGFHSNEEGITIEMKEILYQIENKERNFGTVNKEDVGGYRLPIKAEVYNEEVATVIMAELYISQGLYAKASWVLEQILKTDPNNVEATKKLAQARIGLVNQAAGFVALKN